MSYSNSTVFTQYLNNTVSYSTYILIIHSQSVSYTNAIIYDLALYYDSNITPIPLPITYSPVLLPTIQAGLSLAIPIFPTSSNTPSASLSSTVAITGQDVMNGNYTVTSSSGTGIYNIFSSFNTFKYWQSGSNTYTSSGVYNGSLRTNINNNGTNNSIRGEYITISAPYGFILGSYEITVEQSQNMGSWTLAGSSNNGATFTYIDSQSGVNTKNINKTLTTLMYNIANPSIYSGTIKQGLSQARIQ